MKRAGVLTRETIEGLRHYMRKMGFWPSREDVWHLVDTVDAQRLVIDRFRDNWLADGELGWWMDVGLGDQAREREEMSLAEQLIVYDRVVRSEAPTWPDESLDTSHKM